MEALLEEMSKLIDIENKNKSLETETLKREIQKHLSEICVLQAKLLASTDKNLALTDKNLALTDKNLALTDKILALEAKLLAQETKTLAPEEAKLLVLPEQMSSNVTVVIDVPVSVESQKTELVCEPVAIVLPFQPITCSYNDNKLCISTVGELVDDLHTSRSRIISCEHGENALALAIEIIQSESDNPMCNETDSFIIDYCFSGTTSHEAHDLENSTSKENYSWSCDVGIFQPTYDKYIEDEQDDEFNKDDWIFYGCYNRYAYRYVISYSLLLSYLEDETTKTLFLSEIPEIEMFKDRCISNDIICRKLDTY